MSKILSAKNVAPTALPKKSPKFSVQRAQSSNALPLLKAARVAPKLCQSSTQQQIHPNTSSKQHLNSPLAKEQLNIIYMKMLHQRKLAIADDDKTAAVAFSVDGEQAAQQAKRKQQTTVVNPWDGQKIDSKMRDKNGQKCSSAAKKWTSALRVVSAMTRFKNLPKKQPDYEGSRGSSFSTSNESTPSRTGPSAEQAAQRSAVVDPVYLALKQATAKYGPLPAVSSCTGAQESRRDSQNLASLMTAYDTTPPLTTTTTTTMRNLSQTSLYDSGHYSESEMLLLNARSGSTPQLHGVSVNPRQHQSASRRDTSLGLSAPLDSAFFTRAEVSNRFELSKSSSSARPPKLSSQMKSISLDCAEIFPSSPPMQHKNGGGIRHYGNNHYTAAMNKQPLRSARAVLVSSGGGEGQRPTILPGPTAADEFRREMRAQSPCSATTNNSSRSGAGPATTGPRRQRRLPPVPVVQQQQPVIVKEEGEEAIDHSATKLLLHNKTPKLLHIVIHEYVSGECSLRPGDRLMVLDNGDPDWKHGFKLKDHLEQMVTFPSSCVASYKPDEQPMRLLQSCNLCNLSDQSMRLRLYRDQVVFVQPDSLSNDGKVLVRNEHDKYAKCPLQFLSMS